MIPDQYRASRILAVIPARGGSKGLPNKNILPCAGKPLITWTIEAALNASYVSEVVVSTDDPEIQRIAQQAGAWAPFLRSEALSSDDASVIDVVSDVLQKSEEEKGRFDFVLLLQPTSPLRMAKHIDEAIEQFLIGREGDVDTLVSVCEIEQKILWAKGIGEDGYLYGHFDLDVSNPRRQKLPRCYLPNGAIYLAPVENFSGFYGEKIIPYVMSKQESIDIDYRSDLDDAVKVLEKL